MMLRTLLQQHEVFCDAQRNWWLCWLQAKMQEPLKTLVSLPVDVEGLAAAVPSQLRPPGL